MAKQKFTELENEKNPFLIRARKCSELTLPLVIRQNEGDNSSTDYDTPYQSTGSRGVTNLASNLLLSLFPSQVPFFRLLVSETEFTQFGPNANKIKAEVESALQSIEKTVIEEIESKNLRATIFEVLKNLLVAGNSLVYVQPDGNIRNYTMEDYVVHRDIEGNLTDLIIREQISPTVAEAQGIELPSDRGPTSSAKNITLYTCIQLQKDGQYYVWQEIKGQKLKDTEQYYSKKYLPWLPLRLSQITGESYGRGYVEGIIGDLMSLESLTKALVEAALISAKTIFLVDPASTTRAKALTKARNGDVIQGRINDIGILKTDKGADLSTAFNASRELEQKLAYSFNLLEATMPSSPAKTATEVRAIVNSLEKVLAGVYAMLSSEFMSPLVTLIIARLSDEQKIPQIPEQVKLLISTGTAALGRASDLERIMNFSQIAQSVAPEAFLQLVDQRELINQIATALGASSLLKSDEQLQAEQQAQQQAAMEAQQQELNATQQQQESDFIKQAIPSLLKQDK